MQTKNVNNDIECHRIYLISVGFFLKLTLTPPLLYTNVTKRLATPGIKDNYSTIKKTRIITYL